MRRSARLSSTTTVAAASGGEEQPAAAGPSTRRSMTRRGATTNDGSRKGTTSGAKTTTRRQQPARTSAKRKANDDDEVDDNEDDNKSADGGVVEEARARPAASSVRTVGQSKRKRKVEPDASVDGSAPPEDESSGSDDGDDDDEEPSEDERPAGTKTKTTKSKLKKKVVSWRELARPSTVSFNQFPIEILDHIISVDADLDLRDHLALSATSRFFRSCYNDLVWEILVRAAFPHLRIIVPHDVLVHRYPLWRPIPSEILGPSSYTKSDPRRIQSYVEAGYKTIGRYGPFERGWAPARHIFTSTLGGAPGAARWGLSESEWDVGRAERDALWEVTKAAVLADPAQPRTHSYFKGVIDVNAGVYERPIEIEPSTPAFNVWTMQSFAERRLIYAAQQAEDALSKPFDPWPSEWRSLVCRMVDEPALSKTEAKKVFRINDRELLSVPLIKDGTFYRLSTLQALSLRSHGGEAGHAAHVKKLNERRDKALKTRRKNAASKPTATTARQRALAQAAAVVQGSAEGTLTSVAAASASSSVEPAETPW